VFRRRHSGDGDIRLTVEQNFVISGVPDDKVEEMLAQPIFSKFKIDPPSLQAGLVACTGNQFCGFAKIETKATALDHAERLEAELDIPACVQFPSLSPLLRVFIPWIGVTAHVRFRRRRWAYSEPPNVNPASRKPGRGCTACAGLNCARDELRRWQERS
jgi:hypothetical protein